MIFSVTWSIQVFQWLLQMQTAMQEVSKSKCAYGKVWGEVRECPFQAFFFSDGLVYPVMDRWSYKQHTLWEISRRTLSLKDSFRWKVCEWHLTSVFNHSQNDMYTIHPHIHKPSKIHLRLLYRAVNYNNDLWKETQHNNKPWILMYTWKKY